MSEAIERLTRTFVTQLETHVNQRINGLRDALYLSIVGGKPPRVTARRKGPVQLCPAPGCMQRAAPVFGMLCGKHKDTAKATVAKWREARRRRAAR